MLKGGKMKIIQKESRFFEVLLETKYGLTIREFGKKSAQPMLLNPEQQKFRYLTKAEKKVFNLTEDSEGDK